MEPAETPSKRKAYYALVPGARDGVAGVLGAV